MTAAPEVVAGVDIGGTTTQVVLCTEDLDVIDRLGVPTPAAEGGAAMVGAALGALRLLLDRTPGGCSASGSARRAWWTHAPGASSWPATPSTTGRVFR